MAKSSLRLAGAAASTPTKVSAAEIAAANKQRAAKNLPPLAGTNPSDAAASTAGRDEVLAVLKNLIECSGHITPFGEDGATVRGVLKAMKYLAALEAAQQVLAKAEAVGDRTAETKTETGA